MSEARIYPPAPIKRMSILERRPGDSRAYFSRHWHEVHGGMVSRMPHLYAYVQNHVVGEFAHDRPTFPCDGLVEQLWRSTAEMQRGYNSPVVADLISDEVNYLGHGSNYAILASEALREAPEGCKLVLALRHGGDPSLGDALAGQALALGPSSLLRDDVIATIAKPNFLPVPPHPVDMFLHLHFADPQAAQNAGERLVKEIAGYSFPGKAAFALWQVTTKTIVRPVGP